MRPRRGSVTSDTTPALPLDARRTLRCRDNGVGLFVLFRVTFHRTKDRPMTERLCLIVEWPVAEGRADA